MGMCQKLGTDTLQKNVQTCVVWVGTFIHLYPPVEFCQHLQVIQHKSSSKLACNANRPWHNEAGPTKIDRDEAGRAHIWVLSYLLLQHSSNTNKMKQLCGCHNWLPNTSAPNFWNIFFADCHSLNSRRLSQDLQHCLCDCQVRQQEGVPWGISCQLLPTMFFWKSPYGFGISTIYAWI